MHTDSHFCIQCDVTYSYIRHISDIIHSAMYEETKTVGSSILSYLENVVNWEENV